jgi:hypothetical protein
MSTSRSSKNDSSTSENESTSDNEVSCEESVVVEQTRKTRASSSGHQQRHAQHQPRHTYYTQHGAGNASHSKQFAKNFIIDQQTIMQSGGGGHHHRHQQANPSVRYYISPSSTDARAISAGNSQMPLRNPNMAPGYYQIKDGGSILPSVQACGPQYVFDNYAYKPGFSYMPTYSTGGMPQQQHQQYGMYPANRMQPSNEMKCLPIHRSSEHLDSMGATITSSAGSEFISIKYIAPAGHAGSRLIKGEASSSGGVCPMPNGGRMMPSPGGQTYSSPAIHFMPSGSQHSLNAFNGGVPNYNPYAVQQNSYRMINYDLIHQQQMMQQQIAMQSSQQSQPETDTTGEEESDATSTLSSRGGSKEKKDAALTNSTGAGGSTTPTIATPTKSTPTKSGKSNKPVTTTRINKPVSTNWVLTGGARNILNGSSQARNFLRSTNGYYDDSVNERVILGGSDKQNTKFKRNCRIFGITCLVSFVVIALVLGSVLGVKFTNKSKFFFVFKLRQKNGHFL